MMKYKVGDKVRIRKDIKLGEKYGDEFVVMSMLEHKGEVVTIEDADNYDDCYYVKENIYGWTAEMFEGLAEDVQTDEADKLKYKVGDDELLPEEPVKLYTWQDLCDYEILLYEKWRIANEQRKEQGKELSVMHTLRQEYMEAIKRAMDKLGRDVPVSKAKELGFEV